MHKYIVKYFNIIDNSKYEYIVLAYNEFDAEEKFWNDHELNISTLRIDSIIGEAYCLGAENVML